MHIRPFEEQDFTALHALLSDADVMQYIEPPFSEDQTRAFLHKAGLSDPPLIYAVEKDEDLIGYVIYHDYDAQSKEIGWVLGREHWGKGYATELTRRLIQQAHAEGKAAVLECAPQQSVTRRIAHTFGFQYKGEENGCCVFCLPIPPA